MMGKKQSLKERLAAKAKEAEAQDNEPEVDESTDAGEYEAPVLTDAQVEHLGDTLGQALRDFVWHQGTAGHRFENKIKELLQKERKTE